MFLNEVALGKEHHITRDDHTLTTPPKGFDCVIAKGQTEPGIYMRLYLSIIIIMPMLAIVGIGCWKAQDCIADHIIVIFTDPKDDVTITLGGKAVQVPQGKPISMPQYSSSYFSQSEYLVYKESQARIRYLLKLKF